MAAKKVQKTKAEEEKRPPTVAVEREIYDRLKNQLKPRGKKIIFVVNDVLDKLASYLEHQPEKADWPFTVSVHYPKRKA